MPKNGTASERTATQAHGIKKATSVRASHPSACSVSRLKAALGDSRVDAAQRVRIRAALTLAASAGTQAICSRPPPAGAGKRAPEPTVKQACPVSDLAAAAANPALSASVRSQARKQLSAARKAGITNLCAAPAPAGSKPATRTTRKCSIDQYQRALQDGRLSSAQKQQLRQYLQLMEEQHQTTVPC